MTNLDSDAFWVAYFFVLVLLWSCHMYVEHVLCTVAVAESMKAQIMHNTIMSILHMQHKLALVLYGSRTGEGREFGVRCKICRRFWLKIFKFANSVNTWPRVSERKILKAAGFHRLSKTDFFTP